MTKVRDIIMLAKSTTLKTLPVANDENVLLLMLNQGISDLYAKFNLGITSINVATYANKNMYELENNDLNLILGIYNSDGSFIKQSEILDGVEPVYKLVGLDKFILTKPENGYITVVYSEMPPIVGIEDEIPMARVFDGALLMYLAYVGHTTIHTNDTREYESDVYLSRYNNTISELTLNGYKVELNYESYSVQYKGFV